MTPEQHLEKLKSLVAEYQSVPRGDMVEAFDFTGLLAIIPALLRLFVKDDNLLNILQTVLDLFIRLFQGENK